MKIQILPVNGGLAFLAGINRVVKPAHVTEIANSIQVMGNCRPVVVAKISFINGVPELYIIDGQHLYHALQRLNMPIPYVMIEVKDYPDLVSKLALFNATSKSWSMQDYIQAWTAVPEVANDYKILNEFFNTYDIELSILSSIMMDLEISNHLGAASSLKHIKRGTFKVSDLDKSKLILDYLTDVFKVLKRLGRQENRFVCTEFVKMYRSRQSLYNHNRFIKNLKAKKTDFEMATHEPDTLSSMFKELI
jgi:hypothetical protein